MTNRTCLFFIVMSLLFAIGTAMPSTAFAEDDHADEHRDDHGDEHDDHGDEHGGEDEEGVIKLNRDMPTGLNLNTAKVRRGALTLILELPGEVQWNADRIAHIVPRVGGVVGELNKKLGDSVAKGELLATLDSRELASAKAAYMAAHAREQLAQANFKREQKLWEQKLTAELEYLEAENALTEVKIQKRLAYLQLLAIGVPEDEVIALPQQPDNELTLYRVTVPFAGVIVDRHITHGELLKDDSQIFKIVDMSDVWFMGQAYERDLQLLRKGQKAGVRLDAFAKEWFEGVVDYIASELDPTTRTVAVRIVLNNPQHRLRSSMFGVVTVFADAVSSEAPHTVGLIVPLDAVQRVKDGFIVFKQIQPGEFKSVPVQIHNKSKSYAQVVGELNVGDDVVIADTFLLKSEAAKEEMGGGHGH